MTSYEPSALRSLAKRVADSPNGIFPGVGILTFTGALQAALKWAIREQTYMVTAQSVGATETDARAALDAAATARLARGLPVEDDDTFRDARSRLYTKVIDLV